MGVVGHEPRVVCFAYREQFVHRGTVAVHAEHAIGEHQAVSMRRPVLVQKCGKLTRILVPITDGPATCQGRSGEQARVARLVHQDQVLPCRQSRHDTDVGEISASEHHRIPGALDLRQR